MSVTGTDTQHISQPGFQGQSQAALLPNFLAALSPGRQVPAAGSLLGWPLLLPGAQAYYQSALRTKP
jgi:hypothetical protein